MINFVTQCCAQLHYLWQGNKSFRQGCVSTARWVLQNQKRRNEVWSNTSVELAVRYFLAELPLFLRAPEIINSSSAVFCYHQCPQFVRTLYEQGAYGLLHDTQGFIIRAPAAERPASRPNTVPDVSPEPPG